MFSKAVLVLLPAFGLWALNGCGTKNNAGTHPLNIVTTQQLGSVLTFDSWSKSIFEFGSQLTNSDPNDLDIRCLAYCVKTHLKSGPQTDEELLLWISVRSSRKHLLVVAEKGRQSEWIAQLPPTHNAKINSSTNFEKLTEKAVREFLEETTFGFYDFSIATNEVLYVSEEFSEVLNFLKHPLTEAQRGGRMPMFVAPGP